MPTRRYPDMHPLKSLPDLLCLVTLLLCAGFSSPASAARQVAEFDDIGAGQILFGSSNGQSLNALHMESRVSFSVSGIVNQVELTQRFRNQTDEWQEAVYVLPMSETAAVTEMEIQTGNRLIRADVKERQRARKIYERAKSEGRKAALVEQNRPNLFRQSIANIPPGETIEIRLSFMDRVVYEAGQFSYRFPMTLTPRYLPRGAVADFSGTDANRPSLSAGQVSDVQQMTIPMAGSDDGLTNPIEILIDLDPGLELQEISSPYHEISVKHSHGSYGISLVQGRVAMDRDFVLRWRPLTGSEPQAAIFSETVKGEHYALLMLLPPEEIDGISLPRDMIFVIDTSGSMQGVSIDQAKSSLLKALERLRPQDRFNIIEFNSQWSRLFVSVQHPDAYYLNQARDWVSHLGAGGGTDMLPALQQALSDGGPGNDEHDQLKHIVFITDGAVGNERELFDVIRKQLGSTRLFPVGIGSAPNSYFMRQAARHGRGSFTHIGSLKDVSDSMEALFKKIDSPVATDFSISWPVQSETYPEKIPALYKGEPLLLAAKVSDLNGQVIVRGRTAESTWSRALDLNTTRVSPGVGTLWARQKIDHLTDLEAEGRDSEQTRQDIVTVALAHKLVTKHTSLVAVESIVSRFPEDRLKTSKLPNALASGQVKQSLVGYPKTATPAGLLFLVGLLSLLVAGVTHRMPGR